MLFLDSHQRLFFAWPLIVAHKWETALMKYRISTDYQQASGPPKWEFQDNIVLIPKDIAALTKDFAGAAAAGTGPRAERAKRQIEHAEDEYFSRMGWFTRTHPLELPSGRILVPMYSDGYSYGIMAISDDGGYTWTGSQPIVGEGCIQPSVVRKKDGTLVAYLRDNGPPPKRAHISFSKDDGVTWTPRARHRDPQSGHQPGKHPPAQRQLDHGVQRSGAGPLFAGGRHQRRRRRHLEMEAPPGRQPAGAKTSQYHYPSVIQARDGAIHVTYSYFTPEGKAIKHVRFNEDWVQGRRLSYFFFAAGAGSWPSPSCPARRECACRRSPKKSFSP